MFKDFKQFISRGNVVELSIGVVIGASFNNLVNAIVRDFITPLIAVIFRQPDFSRFKFTIHHSVFDYGDLLSAIISFIIIAWTVYFFVVLPFNSLSNLRLRRTAPAEPEQKKCPYCLSQIPKEATKCAFCTADLK